VPRRICVLVALQIVAAISAGAQISNVQVMDVSNVQALIGFQAPPAASCSVAISEQSDFSKLVPDVNPALFEGADSDKRSGSVIEGNNRIFLVGARTVGKARNRKWYSRALQADTLHYYRIQCGAATAAGTFRTATVPMNGAVGWSIPQDPDTGQFRWPSTDNADRTQAIVDPNYGTLIRRVSIPGDNPGEVDVKAGVFHRASGADWTNPSAAVLKNGGAAHSGGSGWLVLTDARIDTWTPYYLNSQSITSVVARVTGSAAGGDGKMEACLTIDGETCLSDIHRVAMERGEKNSTWTIGSPVPIDTWGAVLWAQDVAGNPNFGVMIRPAPGATVDVNGVDFDLVTNQTTGPVAAGFFSVCQKTPSNGGYRCYLPGSGGGGANWLYWVNPMSGEVRFLGIVLATGWGGNNVYCRTDNAIWDGNDPNVTYCAGYANDNLVILRGRYTGGDQAVKGGSLAPFTWTNITPGTFVQDQVRAFDSSFDARGFGCGLEVGIGTKLILSCAKAGQNSVGFVAVLDIGAGGVGKGKITALLKTFNSPAARWCGLHSIEPVGDIPWVGITPSLTGGMYPVTLKASLQVKSPGAIQVDGEPPFQNAQAGDVFTVESTGDLVRIVSKSSSTDWVVERKSANGAPLTPVAAGTRLLATCSTYYEPSRGAPQIYWNFVDDPKAMDRSNRTTVVERVLSGSHMVNRGTVRVLPDWEKGFNILSPGIPDSFNQPPKYNIVANPRINGIRGEAGVGQNYDGHGDAYQTHPSHENYLAALPANRDWFADIHPFIGAAQFGSGLTAVPGTSHTFQIAVSPLARQTFPTFARCGGRQLKEIPGPVSDNQPYTFCVGAKCSAGAKDSDVFISCPAPVSVKSSCPMSYYGDSSTACAGPMLSSTQAVVQYFLDGSTTAARTLTNGLAAWHNDRTFRILDTPVILPDGSWILFPSFGNNTRRDYYMVKVPAAPKTRQEARPTALKFPAGRDSVSAILEYGRNPALDITTKAVKCASGCTFNISAREGEALFFRVVYTNAAGVREPGPVQARFAGGNGGPAQ